MQGTKLGPYEVQEQPGAGAAGESLPGVVMVLRRDREVRRLIPTDR